ncbi:unnamed protein product, partial [Mesorhabditis belari]|uniref:FBA domain-containing protein n=1 Tax=Mesorhabditis belari TaxID=2138241 RepID=A0AAF3FR99_9BILA
MIDELEPKRIKFDESISLDVWKEIFIRCDEKSLIRLKMVYRQFNSIIDNKFWSKKCERERITLPPEHLVKFARKKVCQILAMNFDYQHLYHYATKNSTDPYGENLFAHLKIKEEDMLDDWSDEKYEIDGSWYNYEIWGCKYETPPEGCRATESSPSKCLAFYGKSGARTITINLKEAGVEDWVMDYIRPQIFLEEKIAPRSDYPAGYSSMIMMCRENEFWYDLDDLGTRGTEIQQQMEQNAPWMDFVHRLEKYPAIMRTLTIRTEGMERNSREHYYGIKAANTVIHLDFPEELHWYKPDEIEDSFHP